MKQISKAIAILLAMVFVFQFAPAVKAQSGANWPDPNFMTSAVLKEKTTLPYYDLDSSIDIYISNGLSYYVDEETQAVVQIFTPDEVLPEVKAAYNEDQLRKMAETIAYEFIKDGTNLDTLSFSLGQKISNYFFHWEDTSKQLDDGTHPFVQIGISENGDFLNLINTLPFGKEAGSFDVSQKMSSVAATYFYNSVYANGGAYWSQSGTFNSVTGGYFYYNPAGCSGSFCSKYYYTTARANPLYWGRWTPTTNTNTRASFFIPNNNVTAWVRYTITKRDGTITTFDVNQNSYINSFAPVGAIREGILYIRLFDAGFNGTGSSAYKVAWDEARIYTQSFDDVTEGHWAYWDIERLFANGITGGCASNLYCPDAPNWVKRSEMAVFLLRGIHSSSYVPPAVGSSTGFYDVATDHWAAAWIKQLYAEGITGGCAVGYYCPDNSVTHAQMAIFLLRSKHGSSYVPPSVYGTRFADVSDSYWAADWIEQLAYEGISYGAHGCTTGYCPEYAVTRAEMAGMLVRTFNLP